MSDSSQPSANTKPQKSAIRQSTDFVTWILLDQWFLVILGILVVVASQVQVPASQQNIKSTAIDYLAVSIIFFINGCTLQTRVLMENLSRWRTHLFVQIQSYFMASAITFGIVSAAALNPTFMDPSLLIGLLILSCLPTT